MVKARRYGLLEKVGVPLAFIGPAQAFLLVFILFPIGYSFYISFHDFFLGSRRPPSWVGWANYEFVLADPVFWQSTIVTLIYTVSVVVGSIVIAFGLALLVAQLRWQRFFLTLILVPVTVPPIVAGLMFKIFFFRDFGIADYLVRLVGLDPPNWLGDPTAALMTLVIVGIWEDIPINTVILMAGLKTVPDDVIESAKIDGASAWQRTWRIIIPLMKPVFVVVLILTMVNSIKQFDVAYSLTSGGPGTATLTMTYYANNVGFEILQIGRAAAASTLIFLTIVASVIGVSLLLSRDASKRGSAP